MGTRNLEMFGENSAPTSVDCQILQFTVEKFTLNLKLVALKLSEGFHDFWTPLKIILLVLFQTKFQI